MKQKDIGMTQEISLFRNFGLATSANATFSESLNAIVGNAYKSMLDHTYVSSFRIVDGLLIKEDIGYARWGDTYLNGVHIYDIQKRTLICESYFHCHYYSRDAAKNDAIKMLTNTLEQAARKDNVLLNPQEVKQKVSDIIHRAYFGDQMQEIQKTFKQLSA